MVAFITCIRRLSQFDDITLFACISNFMRYYLGTCEYKWTHKNQAMEQIWIRRELGDDLYLMVEENNWEWVLLRSESQTLPSDIYCRCDIYAEIPDSKQATLFALKFSNVKKQRT